jgi:hypothetical protein
MVSLNPFRKSKGNLKIIKSVGDHIEAYIGKIAFVMHEKESPLVHVDVYVVQGMGEQKCQYLVTSGMSEKPMPVPEGAEDGRYAELVMGLHRDWPLSPEAFRDEANYWPIRVLKNLARFPHEHKTWMYEGHSAHWLNPPAPIASNTAMTSIVLLRPRLIPEENQFVHVSKSEHIRLWAVYPVYHEEVDLKEREGSSKLDELFDRNGITELLDPRRPTVTPVM